VRRALAAIGLTFVALFASAPSATAQFPYLPQGGPTDYKNYRLAAADPRPNDHEFRTGTNPFTDAGGKLWWMYAADTEPASFHNEVVNADPRELNGVRGAHLVDRTTPNDDLAWATTTGRPDVTIAVLDSGIKWNDRAGMADLRRKTRLIKGELPTPRHDRSTSLEPGVNCASFADADDANGDGVFNVIDYACDSRVDRDPALRGGLGVGPADMLDPQDVLIAFSDGTDDDSNGFRDDIVGWDFLDNDNDPFDDVQYGHGTGEARDSTAEANNNSEGGGELGSCPNCMSIHLRVGDSFIADANRFAQAVIYATDNDALVVQEALGTLNNTKLSRDAVEYAYDHGVVVIASAADEAAQHHNWPSSLPHVIQVNSVTRYDPAVTPSTRSYLQFNGCTNFMSKTTVAIPSTSCSSDATGRGSGMAGLIYSAALNAVETGKLNNHPTCRRTSGDPCVISANEVRQIMASGTIGGTPQADDVNFAVQPEPSCTASPVPSCTDPNLNAPYDKPVPSPLATTTRYPTRKGFDFTFGWGRVNMNKAVDALMPANASRVPAEAEITSPDWYAQVDPGQASLEIRGQVGARGAYTCAVYVAPGSQPNNGLTNESPHGDFKLVSAANGSGTSSWCDGSTRTESHDGVLAELNLDDLKSRFPASAGSFDGREPGTGAQSSNGRPNSEPYGFTVKVVATRVNEPFTGEDRRNFYLHRDQDLLSGFPKQLTGDGEASPLFVDLNADNRNELVVATTDGEVHAYRLDGSELPGWPVRSDSLTLHDGGRAFTSGEVESPPGGGFLASVAAADIDRDGSPEVVGADLEGKVYAWNSSGRRLWMQESKPEFSGKPLQPFVDVRYNRAAPSESKRRRTQHGFIGSPVLADIDQNDDGRLEVVAAAMDRHLYAWNHDGTEVSGFPTLVVDPNKVASVDPTTHAVSFNANAGPALNQGAIIVTPAVGDIAGNRKPEIVVGTNEEYKVDQGDEGPYNATTLNSATVQIISEAGGIDFGDADNPLEGLANAHTRLYAIHSDGESHPGGPIVSGWPAKIGLLQAELLPIVGEGVTGAPVIGPVTCPSGGETPTVGGLGNGGPAYILRPNGQSCYGRDDQGRDITLQTDFTASGQKYDTPAIPAVGHPTFGDFAGGVSFLTPAIGLIRALDVAANEYQGGQDFAAVWDATTGQFRADFPAPVNDLQFVTGPSVADIDGLPGEEAVGGTASLDLYALSAAGAPVSPAWPKLTSDWTVANPTIGSWGTLDTDAAARKRILALTRSGRILAYGTQAPACSGLPVDDQVNPMGSSWPRFHHDNANSGDYRRDAVAPGKPYDESVDGDTLTFKAPGDDLLCGTVRYEVRHSSEPITGANFEGAQQIAEGSADAGSSQSVTLPPDRKRYVAIRAVDDQGNVGPVAVVTIDADLSLTKTDSPDPLLAGQTLTYTLRARNSGPQTATAVRVTDYLPAGAAFKSASSTQGSCTGGFGLVSCELGELAKDAQATVTIEVTPQTSGTIENRATVDSAEHDPDPTNNAATASTTVDPAADLQVTKTDSPDPVHLGQQLTYAITVKNNGGSNASGVILNDQLPRATGFGSVSTSQGSCTRTKTSVTCNLRSLASGATATVTIVVKPTQKGTITNTASATATQPSDPNTANNTATATTTVLP
jgi:uncharacterized repeat protein (TIGR01451 family)